MKTYITMPVDINLINNQRNNGIIIQTFLRFMNPYDAQALDAILLPDVVISRCTAMSSMHIARTEQVLIALIPFKVLNAEVTKPSERILLSRCCI